MIVRILPHEARDGASNLAIDEALLDAVDDDPSRAVLRTYEWSPPTLSLGYFQAIAEAEEDPRWRDAPIVRRPTGGGAIWHHHDLTYAVVIPRSHPAARASADLYRAVHAAIAGVLAGFGVAARRRGPDPAAMPGTRPFLCFSDRDPEDIVTGGVKVVGSAQRRRPGAVLQHGSVLFAPSGRTPELPGLGGPALTPDACAAPIRDAIAAALGLTPLDDRLQASERDRAQALEREVYRNPLWTGRR